MAPEVGLEPTTLRLTAECSAIELLRSVQEREIPHALRSASYNKYRLWVKGNNSEAAYRLWRAFLGIEKDRDVIGSKRHTGWRAGANDGLMIFAVK